MLVKFASPQVPLRLARSSLRASSLAGRHGLGKRWSSAYTWLTTAPEAIVTFSIPIHIMNVY